MNKLNTGQPRYSESLYSELVDIMNDFLYPSNSEINEKRTLI